MFINKFLHFENFDAPDKLQCLLCIHQIAVTKFFFARIKTDNW
jgi:hypothetical protein